MDTQLYTHPDRPPMKVVFVGKGGYSDEAESAVKEFEVGKEYTVTGGFISASSCYYLIEGKLGRWNSVLFTGEPREAPVVDMAMLRRLTDIYEKEQRKIKIEADLEISRQTAATRAESPEWREHELKVALTYRHPDKPPLPVVFHGVCGDEYAVEQAACVFEVGKEYLVVGGLMSNIRTYYRIEGIEGDWNSALFTGDIFQAPVVTYELHDRLWDLYFPDKL